MKRIIRPVSILVAVVIVAVVIRQPLQAFAMRVLDSITPLVVVVVGVVVVVVGLACISGLVLLSVAGWGDWLSRRSMGMGLPADPAALIGDDDGGSDYTEAWVQATLTFAAIASKRGLRRAVMLEHTTWGGYQAIIEVLEQVQWVRVSKGGTEWEPERGGYKGLRAAVTHGVVSLPVPAAKPPPLVTWSKTTSTVKPSRIIGPTDAI